MPTSAPPAPPHATRADAYEDGRDQEDHSKYGPLAQANAWAALQTFNAGLRLAASQQIQDSGGVGRILLATATPHIDLTGDVQVSAGLSLRGRTLPGATDFYTSDSATGIGVLVDRGGLASGGGGADLVGVSGRAATISGGTHTGRVVGLEFFAFSNRNLVSPASEVTGISVEASAVFSTNVRATLQRGIHLKASNVFGGTLGVDCRGAEIQDPSAGQAGVTTAYGLKIDDITGATNVHPIFQEGASDDASHFNVIESNTMLFTQTGSFGGGIGVLGVRDAATVPTSNPTSGGIQYSTGGAGTWRGSGGTVTTFGPAEPYCPDCGNDFVLDMKNTNTGRHLRICWWCFSEGGIPGLIKRENPARPPMPAILPAHWSPRLQEAA